MAKQYEVIVGALNLRATPGGTILTTLPRASRLEEAGDVQMVADATWIKVSVLFSGATGYVVDKYVHAIDTVGQQGPEAGADGAVTAGQLRALSPTSRPWIVNALAESFHAATAPYGIAGNPLRMCHFLAQAAHESAGFRTLEEFGGEPWWKRYEGRADLGNTQTGDGIRYHGRGIFQLTGRANYRSMGTKVNRLLEQDPTLAAEPDVSLQTACEYWRSRKLEVYADRNDIEEITRRINGGFNGLAERQAFFRRAWSIWGEPGRPAGI